MTNSSEYSPYEAIFETCEEGIIVVNQAGKIVLCNRSATRLFGYTAEEMRQLTVEDLIPKPLRQTHQRDREQYNKHARPRKMGVGRDLIALKKNGDEFPVEISLNQTPVNGEEHTVAFIIDISERKKIEHALRQSEEQLILYASQLENRVSRRTKELDDTIAKLEVQVSERKKAEAEALKALEKEKELNELKSRFVSMASHEFRTPLSTILSSASLISKYKAEEQDDKRQRHIDKIKLAIGNLNNILDDFLSLAKLEEGRIDIEKNKVNLREHVAKVVSEMETLLKPGQHFDVAVADHTIETDEKILKIIVTNLTSNAIKYSDSGAIGISVAATTDGITITISDQGMGIPLADQPHLFERFFRAKNAINIQGTGLGLNIVKKYVEMLDGTISFESDESRGTMFKVTLPQ